MGETTSLMKRLNFNHPVLRRLLKWACLAGVLGIAFIGYTYLSAWFAAHGKTTADTNALTHRQAGLVFGCSPKIGEDENLFFRYRIEAAARLWQSGKVDCLLVSGDNRSRYYNEPVKMRDALMAHGVPKEKIISDYAGLSTLDSVMRAKEIFGLTDVTFVTQRFHNDRAIYLARANGITAQGFNAKDVSWKLGWKTRVREIPARVKMWLDVNLLNTRPRHGGQRIELPK